MTSLPSDHDLLKESTVDRAEEARLAKASAGGPATEQVEAALGVLIPAIKSYVGEDSIAYEQSGAEEAARKILKGKLTKTGIEQAYEKMRSLTQP